MVGVVWSIKDLVEVIDGRRNNKFSVEIVVSGGRGSGKSTLLFKLFLRFKGFNAWKHMVYSRRDVMELLEGQKFGFIFDDEAIRTQYKRNFYDPEQKLLIQMINMYRDNFNIYASAIPSFYNLDKDFRDLVKIHIHVVERGVAILHIARTERLYSDDVWDIKYNKKIEESWAKKKKKNPRFIAPYEKLSTYIGVLRFGDLTKKQRELYEKIKVKKRRDVFLKEMMPDRDKSFVEKIYDSITEGKLTKEGLLQLCLFEGQKYSSVQSKLNQMLKDKGIGKTLTQMLLPKDDTVHNNLDVEINQKAFKPTIV